MAADTARRTTPLEHMTCTVLNGHWGGVELLSAAYRSHRFPVHAHPDVHIALIETGRYGFRRDRDAFVACPGDLILFGPDDPHDGETLTETGYSYRQILIPTERWEAAGNRRRGGFQPSSPVLRRDQLAAALRYVFKAKRAGDAMLLDAGLARVIAQLAEEPAGGGSSGGVTSAMIRAVIDRMEADLAEPWTLQTLAETLGTNRFALTRAFRRERGIGLHDWLTFRRLHRARLLLVGGMPAAEAAVAAGFADQSHLIRHFKRVFGVTPGWFSAACTSIQSPDGGGRHS